MISPKKVKHRKQHRGRMKGKSLRGNTLTYGNYGLQALEPAWITGNQIEAARIAMTRYSKRGGSVWIKIFPDKPITAKPAETRMGKGKGAPENWVAVVKPGRVMFELAGVTEEVAREALRLAAHKLPCKVKFIKREGEFDIEGVVKRRRKVEILEPATATATEAEGAASSETGGELDEGK